MCIIEDTSLTVPVLKGLLTQAQYRSVGITAVGFSVKEAADMTYTSENTVQTHIKDAKEIIDERAEAMTNNLGLKRNQHLSRSELRFAFICQFLGHNPSDVRKRILASLLSIAIILATAASSNVTEIRRGRLSIRRTRLEYIAIYNAST